MDICALRTFFLSLPLKIVALLLFPLPFLTLGAVPGGIEGFAISRNLRVHAGVLAPAHWGFFFFFCGLSR